MLAARDEQNGEPVSPSSTLSIRQGDMFGVRRRDRLGMLISTFPLVRCVPIPAYNRLTMLSTTGSSVGRATGDGPVGRGFDSRPENQAPAAEPQPR